MSTRRLLQRHRPRSLCQHRTFTTCPQKFAEEVRIVEVGPRDGLQNEKTSIALDTKIELIRRLATTGLRTLEAGSFVAPKWVPQMANSADVLNHILGHPPTAPHAVSYNFLVPNLRGLEDFLEASRHAPVRSDGSGDGSKAESSSWPRQANDSTSEGPDSRSNSSSESSSESSTGSRPQPEDILPSKTHSSRPAISTEISIFAAATEAFSKANINCTIAESMERFKPIVSLAKSKGVRIRGYVSVALGCPYEGPNVSPSKVAEVTTNLLEMGVDEVSVADTTGMGTVPRTQELLKTLTAAGISHHDIALHFHDTYGQALSNTIVGLDHGIRIFDSSVGGLGGCPYSKGATGNVATEDLVYSLHSLGIQTGVDVAKMAEVGTWISNELGRPNESRVGKAISARLSSYPGHAKL